MRNLSSHIILLVCVLASLQVVAAVAPTPPTSSRTVAPPTIKAAAAKLQPVITGFGSSSCVSSGALLTVLGSNFGGLKGLSLVAEKSHIPLKITAWQNSKITAYLPKSEIMKAGTTYPVGIRDTRTNAWLSNTDKTIVACQSKPSGSQLTEPTASDPDSGETIDQAEQFNDNNQIVDSAYTTQALLPGGFGSLMNRQLPANPPKLSISPAIDASGNAIAEPNELLVVSNNMEEAKLLAQQLNGYGLLPKKRKILKNLGIVMTTYRVPTNIDIQQTAINIRQAYPGMWADINHRYTLQGNNRNTQLAKKQINWDTTSAQCGKGLRIGLIDTEINKLHPALKSQTITSHSVLSEGIKKAKKSHATAIAILLIGNHNSESFSGMLPSAKLFSVSVFRQRDEKNIDTTAEWIVSGIDWLLSQNVQVINMSVGGPRNLLVDVAIQRTIQSGIPVIAAAGNGGSTAAAVFPAAQPGVIAVTAVDNNLELYSKANEGKYIDFSAPGVDIWTGNDKGTGKFVSGTSFAVPFVTAAMANLLKEESPEKAYQQLQEKSKDLGNKGKDEQFGWGLVQKSKACL